VGVIRMFIMYVVDGPAVGVGLESDVVGVVGEGVLHDRDRPLSGVGEGARDVLSWIQPDDGGGRGRRGVRPAARAVQVGELPSRGDVDLAHGIRPC
jgi:hypothetical protein